ncbi:GTP-binding protein [Shimia sp.]|uniref:CobW family GTP-binding protein n=1 Tax=Shimia sp. TaxID=1954381 RepID=UPI003297C699
MLNEPIDVAIVTGFLGAGKSTLLECWLKGPDWSNTAVIVNELGAIGIDQHVLDGAVQGVLLLENGCICCSRQDDLVGQIHDMLGQRARGEIQAFDRLVIETTGIADPVPVLYTFLSDPILASCFSCPNVITVVDGTTCVRLLQSQPISIRQIACADVLIVTRKDKLDPTEIADLNAILGQQSVAPVLHSSIDDPVTAQRAFDCMRANERDLETTTEMMASGAHHHNTPFSFCLQTEASQTSHAINAWIAHLLKRYGEQLLRMKGVIHVSDEQRTVILQAVGQAFDPPREINTAQKGTSIVVILDEHADKSQAEQLFRHLLLERETISA